MTELARVRRKRANYKSCFYRNCRSTTITTPENIFVPVPKGEVRRGWIKIIRHDDERDFSLQSPLYCCGEHFNLKEDLENYTRLLLDPTANVRLKKGVKPKVCRLDTALDENFHDQTKTEIFNEIESSSEPKFSHLYQSLSVQTPICVKEEFIPRKDVGVQTDRDTSPKMSSKYIQCKPIMVDGSCSPIPINTFNKHNWTFDR